MKRLILLVLMVVAFVAMPISESYGAIVERSKNIVYINGSRYYVHPVRKGDTIYSLSKLYNLKESEIIEANPTIEDGLQLGVNIKIPTTGEVVVAKPLSSRKQRKTFDSHVVEAGETLYSISRKYEISVQTILADNPKLDPASLSVGQMLVIRKAEQGLADEMQTKKELHNYNNQMNKVAPEGYAYHVVVKGDTSYSLSKECGLSVEEFMRINSMKSGEALSLGQIVLLRSLADDDVYDDSAESVHHMVSNVDFRAIASGETLRVALLLPLTINGKVVKPFEAFYKGFLLGVEDLRKAGRSVEVNLYNTERSESKIKDVLDEQGYKNSNLIVGPVYEELLAPILQDAEKRGVPVVSPLATLASADSPVLFQMAPDTESRNDKILDLLDGDQTVTLIYSDKNNAAYNTEVKGLLNRLGIRYKTHMYEYEHPSLAQERHIAAKKRVERMQESARNNGYSLSDDVVDSLLRVSSNSDLTSLIVNGAKSNTFFVMSDNEVDVDRILSALASAYTAQVAINSGSNVDLSKKINFRVVANPEWRHYDNIDKTIFFRDRLVMQSSYHASRDSKVIRDFDSRYADEFDEFSSLYSYRGYDVAKIFGEGMYSDIEYGMEGRVFKPLQTTYRFESCDGKLHRVNTNWSQVNYNPDFTLTIE